MGPDSWCRFGWSSGQNGPPKGEMTVAAPAAQLRSKERINYASKLVRPGTCGQTP